MKHLLVISILAFFTGCASLNIDQLTDNASEELPPGYGILALSLNSIEKINNISMVGRQDFVIKWPEIGENIYLYSLPEGEYCLQRMVIGRYTVSIKSGAFDTKGMCTMVEAGTVNYSGHIYLRAEPVQDYRYKQFVRQFSKQYPNTCKAYIGNSCEV